MKHVKLSGKLRIDITNPMTNLNTLIKRRQGEFRVQYDELGLKQPKNSMKNLERELIIDYWRKVSTEAYRQALLDLREGLPGDKKIEIELPDTLHRNIGHNTVLQTVRTQIEGLLGKIE
jgi:hypothetical protein